jgi:hypothetical protein
MRGSKITEYRTGSVEAHGPKISTATGGNRCGMTAADALAAGLKDTVPNPG